MATTTIYLVRHCEAEGNWKRLFQGHYDGKVSELGYQQLAHLAERFCSVKLDAVYSSPLTRAMETARAINRCAQLPIQQDDGLLEINGGAFEGKPFAELPILFAEAYDKWEHDPAHFTAPGGESMQQVYDRMRDTIDRIARTHEGGTVAIASHGCAIRNYQCYVRGLPLSQVNSVTWCDNTAVNCIEYDSGFQPHIIYLNDTSHLPEGCSSFMKQTWWRKNQEESK
ncbi:MAG: histidine phosphatase family protein [Anaerotruncus sp.]|jgi:broad specificity phosphatase PhoE|nr:histidine phosphatase family protein [Anaerotruncus sp.]